MEHINIYLMIFLKSVFWEFLNFIRLPQKLNFQVWRIKWGERVSKSGLVPPECRRCASPVFCHGPCSNNGILASASKNSVHLWDHKQLSPLGYHRVNQMPISIDYLGGSVGWLLRLVLKALCKSKGNWKQKQVFFCVEVMESIQEAGFLKVNFTCPFM